MPGIFGQNNVRLAVLEEKLDVYEDLSREMLSKLETAVDKISEANQNVARILVRHEERLDQGAQNNTTTMKLIEEIKTQRKDDLSRLSVEIGEIKKSVDEANDKIDEISKYRWIFAGAILILSFFISEGDMLFKLIPQQEEYRQPPIEYRSDR